MDLHITAILHESAISLAERPLRYLPGAMNFDDDPKAIKQAAAPRKREGMPQVPPQSVPAAK